MDLPFLDVMISLHYLLFVVFLIGLCFGSFATMACYRIPRGLDIVFTRSKCTSCKHVLSIVDLFPLCSWLMFKNRCRYCKAPIGYRYIAVELITALMFVWIFLLFGVSWLTLVFWALGLTLIIMSAIDFEFKIIPDSLQIVMLVLVVLFHVIMETPALTVIRDGALGLGFALALRYGFWLWKKKEGLGFGDVKFFATIGMLLGPWLFVPFLMLSGLLGIATALIWQIAGKGKLFPFGPALGMSMFLVRLYPEKAVVLFKIGEFFV